MATADVSYVPGALTAVAGDQCWALVDASPDSPAVTRIWRQLGQGAAADALLAGLLGDGIGDTAGFTLLVAEAGGQHRLFCRGTVGATVITAPADGGAPPGEGQATAERVNGAGLLTWREQVVDNAERIFLGEPPADTALRLPATSGVLLADCVVVDRTSFAGQERTTAYFPDTITMTDPGGTSAHPAASDVGGQGGPDSRALTAPAVPTLPFTTSPVEPSDAPSRPDDPVPASSPAPLRPAAAEASGNLNGGPGDDGEYDFFWGATQARSVEDAAMRGAGERDAVPSGHLPPNGTPAVGSPAGYLDGMPAARPWPGPPGPPASGEFRPGPPLPGVLPVDLAPPVMPPSGAIASPPCPVPAPAPGPPGGLIDVPTWLSGSSDSAPSPAWGVPGGAWSAPHAPQAEAAPGQSSPTVKRGELAEIVSRTTPPDRIGPVVPALLCPDRHVNPPSGTVCRRCNAPLPHDPVPVPRPVLGLLRLSLGDVITLDRGVLMGRNPRTDFGGPDGAERPHVVKLPSADGYISRTHLKVTLDGWHVLVTDLKSTNGTLVTLPGRDPQQLRPGEPVPIQPSTVVTLADGIDFRYEVTD